MTASTIKGYAYTGGLNVPSARLRVRQHISRLRTQGIVLVECPAKFGSYPPQEGVLRRVAWGGISLLEGTYRAVRSHAGDFSLLQREFMSTFYTAEPLTKRPRILDVDDAIWLRQGGDCARALAQASQRIICGNSFIAEQFSRWNRNIEIIPTGVDTDRYTPYQYGCTGKDFVIGWCGTSSGYRYLYEISTALKSILGLPRTRLLIVSDQKPAFVDIDPAQISFVRWSEAAELTALRQMSVGIMPLDDSDWSRGKCSYKMLSYMASGLPVVVSDYGMNSDVLALGKVGIGVKTLDQWTNALHALYEDRGLGIACGMVGRKLVEQTFSAAQVGQKLAAVLRSVAGCA